MKVLKIILMLVASALFLAAAICRHAHSLEAFAYLLIGGKLMIAGLGTLSKTEQGNFCFNSGWRFSMAMTMLTFFYITFITTVASMAHRF